MKTGTKLIIPITPGRHEAGTTAYSRKATRYKVRKGDTLASVADDFEVPVEKLRHWNHVRGNKLVPGHTLLIYKPVGGESAEAEAPAPSGARASKTLKYHKVKKGETLVSIAESNHTSVAALKRDNPKFDAGLQAGDMLVIRK